MPETHPGRPSLGKVRIAAYIPTDMEQEIRSQAESEFRPLSDHVYYLLSLGLEAKKQQGAPQSVHSGKGKASPGSRL
jgi:hypothetical protein